VAERADNSIAVFLLPFLQASIAYKLSDVFPKPEIADVLAIVMASSFANSSSLSNEMFSFLQEPRLNKATLNTSKALLISGFFFMLFIFSIKLFCQDEEKMIFYIFFQNSYLIPFTSYKNLLKQKRVLKLSIPFFKIMLF
jgi:fluoride ion exporter CrcB/FEX